MVYEIVVTHEGAESILTFDVQPSFSELRVAVACDIVGGDNFDLQGTSARGSVVKLKDQSALNRVLGGRKECTIEVVGKLVVTTKASPQRTKSSLGAPLKPRKPIVTVGGTCEGSINDLSSVVKTSLTVGNTVWLAERDTGCIAVRDASDCAALHTIKYHSVATSAVTCHCLLAVTRNKKTTVWAGFTNKQIKVFDSETYQVLNTLGEHSGAVLALAQGHGLVFSASSDFTVLAWDVDKRTMVKLFSGHTNAVRSLATVGKRLASGGDDGLLVLWNAVTSEPVFQVTQAHGNGGVHALVALRTGLWSGGEDGSVKVWDSETGEPLAVFQEHRGRVLQLVKLERKILSVGADTKVNVYDAFANTAIGSVTHPHAAGPLTLQVTNRHQNFGVWCAAGDKTLSLWRFEDAAIDDSTVRLRWDDHDAEFTSDQTSPRSGSPIARNHADPTSGINGNEAELDAAKERIAILEADLEVAIASAVAPSTDRSDDAAETKRTELELQDAVNRAASLEDENRALKQQLLEEKATAAKLEKAAATSRPQTPAASSGESAPPELIMARLQLDESNGRHVNTLKEGRAWAELMLRERNDRGRHEVPQDVAMGNCASLVIDGHRRTWETLLESQAHSGSAASQCVTDMCRTAARESATSAAQIRQMREQQDDVEGAHVKLRAKVETLSSELRAMHDQYDSLLAAHDKRKVELDTATNTRLNSEESLRRYQAECRALQRQTEVLEKQLEETRDTNRVQRQESGDAYDARLQELEEALKAERERRTTTEAEAEAAVREARQATADLRALKDQVEADERRLEQKVSAAKSAEDKLQEKLESERKQWKDALATSDANYDQLKSTLMEQLEDATAAKERAELAARDAQEGRRAAEDELALVSRRANLAKETHDQSVNRMAAQLQDSEENRKAEVNHLESLLNERSVSESFAAEKRRSADTELLEMQATHATLTRRNSELTEQVRRLSTDVDTSVVQNEAKVESLQAILADTKAELANQVAALQAERAARGEAERQLLAVEESYEAQRRRHGEEIQGLMDETTREKAQLQQRVRSLEEGSGAATRELAQQLEVLKTQCDAAMGIQQSLEAERDNLADDVLEKNVALAAAEQTLENERTAHGAEVDALRRELEARKAATDDLSVRRQRDAAREAETAGQTTAKIEQLENTMADRERDIALLRANAAEEGREIDALKRENARLQRATDSVGAAHDGRVAALEKHVAELREEAAAANATTQERTLEAEAAVRAVDELETLLRAVKDESVRTVERHDATLAEKDTELSRLAIRNAELEREATSVRGELDGADQRHRDAILALERQLQGAKGEARTAAEETARAKERGDQAQARMAALLQDRQGEAQTYKAAQEQTIRDLEGRLARTRDDLEAARAELREAHLRTNSEMESLGSEKRLLSEHAASQRARVDDLESQLSSRTDELAALQRRHAEELVEADAAASKRIEAVRDATNRAKTQLLDEVEATKKLLQSMVRERDDAIAAKHALDEDNATARRATAVIKSEHEAQVQAMRLDVDSAKRVHEQLKAELEALATKHRNETEGLNNALAKKSAEADEAAMASRKFEARAMEASLDAQQAQRQAKDLERQVETLRGRLDTDFKSREDVLKGHNATQEQLRNEAMQYKREALERQVEAKELERQLQAAEETVAKAVRRVDEIEAARRSDAADARERQRVMEEAVTQAKAAAESERSRATSESVARDRDANSMQAELRAAKDRLATIDERQDSIRGSHQAELLRANQALDAAQTKIIGLEKDLDAVKMSYREAQLQSERSANALQSAEASLRHIENDVASEHSAGQERQRTLESKLEAATTAHREALLEADRQKIMLEALESAAAKHGEQLADAERTRNRDCDKLRSELDEAQAALRSSRREKERLAASEAHATERIAMLESDGQRARERHEAELERTRSDADKLHEKIRGASGEAGVVARKSLEWFASASEAALLAADAKTQLAMAFSEEIAAFAGETIEKNATELSSIRSELQRQTADLVDARRSMDRARSVSTTHHDLLDDVRLEMQHVYKKYKEECEAHDQTRQELMAARGQRTAAERDAEAGDFTEGNYLRTVVVTLEAEKKALETRLQMANVDRLGTDAHRLGAETASFILSTREELVLHVSELVEGLVEAAKLMYLLGFKPARVPDTETLVGVHHWLESARSRGDVILRTLVTEDEKLLLQRRR